MEQQREDEGEDARGSGAESAVDAGGIALSALGKPVVGLRGAYREGGDATACQTAEKEHHGIETLHTAGGLYRV